MPAFTTLALIGLGAAGAAASYALNRRTSQSGSRRNERRASGHEIVGRAVPRGSVPPEGLTAAPEAPPSTTLTSSANLASARAAGERARKRAAAGGTVLSKGQQGMPPVRGVFNPKTLLGG